MDQVRRSGEDTRLEVSRIPPLAMPPRNIHPTLEWSDYEDDPNWAPESFTFPSNSGVIPRDTGPRSEEVVNLIPSKFALFTGFHHLDREDASNNEGPYSTWSPSSSDSDDSSPTSILDAFTDTAPESTEPPLTKEPAVPTTNVTPPAARYMLRPDSLSRLETGGTSANLARAPPQDGPFRPPTGSDFWQLVQQQRHAEQKLAAPLNGAQTMLLRRLGAVQDRERRTRVHGGADEFRRELMARKERVRPIMASGFGPAWDNAEERLWREKSRRFKAEHELHLAMEREKGLAEVVEVLTARLENVLSDVEARIGLAEFNLKVKENELDLLKKAVPKKFAELKEKCKAMEGQSIKQFEQQLGQVTDELRENKLVVESKQNKLQSLALEMKSLVQEKEALSHDLRAIKIEFIRWMEADSPIEYVSALFERAELDSARETAAKFEAENVVLRNAQVAVNKKIEYLVPPQDVQAIERRYQRQIDNLMNDAVTLQEQETAWRVQHEDKVQHGEQRLREAQAAASEAQARNEQRLKHIENLATQVRTLEEKLALEGHKIKKLEEQLDQHDQRGPGPAKRSRCERNETVMHFNEGMELAKEVELLRRDNSVLKTQTTADAKRIKEQRERIRGLEVDLIGINESHTANLEAENEPRKVYMRRGHGKYDSTIDAAVQKQMSIDNEKWAKREERWEKLFGLKMRISEHGHIRLEAGGAYRGHTPQDLQEGRDRFCREKCEETEQKRRDVREEFQRIHEGVTMRLRRSGWSTVERELIV